MSDIISLCIGVFVVALFKGIISRYYRKINRYFCLLIILFPMLCLSVLYWNNSLIVFYDINVMLVLTSIVCIFLILIVDLKNIAIALRLNFKIRDRAEVSSIIFSISSLIFFSIIEEIYIRVFVQQTIAQRFPMLSIMISTIIFILHHMIYPVIKYRVKQLLMLTVMSLLNGILFHLTQNLIYPVLCHLIFNLPGIANEIGLLIKNMSRQFKYQSGCPDDERGGTL